MDLKKEVEVEEDELDQEDCNVHKKIRKPNQTQKRGEEEDQV